jgi:tRNA threonylcarbamoyladenosine biosynthesis protein TsaE
MNISIKSSSPEATETIAEKIGQQLKGGEVIELISDLGGGKTRFVSGLARGIKSEDHVSSPSFTISKLYTSPKLSIYHFDLYRLDEPGIMRNEISDILNLPDVVLVVEWGDSIQDILPEKRIEVKFNKTDNDKRLITITYPKELKYLVKDYENTDN